MCEFRLWGSMLIHQCPEVLDGTYCCAACARTTFHLVLNSCCQDVSCLLFWCLSGGHCSFNGRPGCNTNRHVLGLWKVIWNFQAGLNSPSIEEVHAWQRDDLLIGSLTRDESASAGFVQTGRQQHICRIRRAVGSISI